MSVRSVLSAPPLNGRIESSILPSVNTILYYPSEITSIYKSGSTNVDNNSETITIVREPTPDYPNNLIDIGMPALGARGRPPAPSANPHQFSSNHVFFFDGINQSIKRYDPIAKQWYLGFIIVSNAASSSNCVINDRITIPIGVYPSFFAGNAGMVVVGAFSQVQRAGKALKNVSNAFFWDSVADDCFAIPETSGALGLNGEIFTVDRCPVGVAGYAGTNLALAFGGIFNNISTLSTNAFINFCLYDSTAQTYLPLIASGDAIGSIVNNVNISQFPFSMRYSHTSGNLCIGGNYTSYILNGVTTSNVRPCNLWKLTANSPRAWTITSIGDPLSSWSQSSAVMSVSCDNHGSVSGTNYTRFYNAGAFQVPISNIQTLYSYPTVNVNAICEATNGDDSQWGRGYGPTQYTKSYLNYYTSSDATFTAPVDTGLYITGIGVGFDYEGYLTPTFNLVVNTPNGTISSYNSCSQSDTGYNYFQFLFIPGFAIPAGQSVTIRLPYGQYYAFWSQNDQSSPILSLAGFQYPTANTILSSYHGNDVSTFTVSNPINVNSATLSQVRWGASSPYLLPTNANAPTMNLSIAIINAQTKDVVVSSTNSVTIQYNAAALNNLSFTMNSTPLLQPNITYAFSVRASYSPITVLTSNMIISTTTIGGPAIYVGAASIEQAYSLAISGSLTSGSVNYVYNNIMYLEEPSGNELVKPIQLPQLVGCPVNSPTFDTLAFSNPDSLAPTQLITFQSTPTSGVNFGMGTSTIDISGNYGSYTYSSPSGNSIVPVTLRANLSRRAYFGKSFGGPTGREEIYLVEGEGGVTKAYQYETNGADLVLSCDPTTYINYCPNGGTTPVRAGGVCLNVQYSSVTLSASSSNPGAWDVVSTEGSVGFVTQ